MTIASERAGALTIGQFLWALVIGATGYGLSITWWVKGARDLGAARAQVIFATAPFIGAVGAWMYLNDAVSGTQLAAIVLAAAGVGLSLDSAHGHRHRHEPTAHDHEHSHPDEHHGHEHLDRTEVFVGRHTHRHAHDEVLVHDHPHVPDLHHHHPHE